MKLEWRQCLFVLNKLSEALLGLAAIEKYLRDMRVLPKERFEVIRGFFPDMGIQTGFALAGSQHIP